MPPPLSRYPSGPNALAPYQQFAQPHHQASHAPHMSANSAYQVNAFTANNNLLGLAGGLSGGQGFGITSDTGLGSHAARLGFQQAGLQQQHSQQQNNRSQHSLGEHAAKQAKARIREVWKQNLQEEMAVLRDLVDRYPYIAMDTEFPGIVSRPMGGFRGKSDYHYQCLRTNVDLLNVIQIGLALFNEKGEQPPARPGATEPSDSASRGPRDAGQGMFPCAWQFNFSFSVKKDMYNETSIESLRQAGIDFDRLDRDGIDPHEFASLLIPSGLVCFDNVRWISFHGGYDFGYLTKLLICRPLPNDEVEFDQTMKLYFPSTYDVKHLMKHAIKLHNSGMISLESSDIEVLQKFEQKAGLENIAETLKIKRLGAAHQAGSDSLLTGKVFFELRRRIYKGEISDDHIGRVWGLNIPDWSAVNSVFNPAGGGSGNTNGGQVESTPPGPNGAGLQNGRNTPGTPNTVNITMVGTPAGAASGHNTNGLNLGPMTPGGGGGGSGGGVFGSFAFGGNSR